MKKPLVFITALVGIILIGTIVAWATTITTYAPNESTVIPPEPINETDEVNEEPEVEIEEIDSEENESEAESPEEVSIRIQQ